MVQKEMADNKKFGCGDLIAFDCKGSWNCFVIHGRVGKIQSRCGCENNP